MPAPVAFVHEIINNLILLLYHKQYGMQHPFQMMEMKSHAMSSNIGKTCDCSGAISFPLWYTLIKQGRFTMEGYDIKRHIDILNKHLGMGHKTREYNLTETSELKAALEYAVAAYMDYHHYMMSLSSLIEKFDESVEYFDTESWVSMTGDPNNVDDLVYSCTSSLSAAFYKFSDLAGSAYDHLEQILKIVVTAPTEAQIEILGKSFVLSPSEIDRWLEGLFDALYEAEYHSSIPDNFKEFLKIINASWEEDVMFWVKESL